MERRPRSSAMIYKMGASLRQTDCIKKENATVRMSSVSSVHSLAGGSVGLVPPSRAREQCCCGLMYKALALHLFSIL